MNTVVFTWDVVWASCFILSKNLPHQMINYKLVNRAHITSSRLYKMEIRSDPYCYLCNKSRYRLIYASVLGMSNCRTILDICVHFSSWYSVLKKKGLALTWRLKPLFSCVNITFILLFLETKKNKTKRIDLLHCLSIFVTVNKYTAVHC